MRFINFIRYAWVQSDPSDRKVALIASWISFSMVIGIYLANPFREWNEHFSSFENIAWRTVQVIWFVFSSAVVSWALYWISRGLVYVFRFLWTSVDSVIGKYREWKKIPTEAPPFPENGDSYFNTSNRIVMIWENNKWIPRTGEISKINGCEYKWTGRNWTVHR